MHRIIRSLRRIHPSIIIFSLVVASVITSVISFEINQNNSGNAGAVWWASWFQNFSAGLLGSAITFWLIDILFGSQRERDAEEHAIQVRKEQLLRQLASKVNSDAIRAVEELRFAGWLSDGTLEGANLNGADLQGADFNHARLNRASFRNANLHEAILNYADMRESFLIHANLRSVECRVTDLSGASIDLADLRYASFEYANLQDAVLRVADASGAYFSDANMHRAVLWGTKLQGACLIRANLREVNIPYNPYCDEKTMLPDGTYWQNNDDLKKFTDPTHPKFFKVITPYWNETNADKTSE